MIDIVYGWLVQQIGNNDVFAGLLGASLVGGLAYLAKGLPKQILAIADRQLTVTLQVHNDDPAFEVIQKWLAQLPYASRARRLSLSTFGASAGGMYSDHGQDERDWNLAPGQGQHWFFRRGRVIWLTRAAAEDKGSAKRREHFDIKIIGRSQSVVREMLTEARALVEHREEVQVHSYQGGYWECVARKTPRTLESVILEAGQSERVRDDMQRFLDSAQWYYDRGVPYRRGYLFAGTPGCGKTSFVLALASHFKIPVYSVNLGSVLGDETLFAALGTVPPRSILLMEDIDAAKAAKRRVNEDDAQTVTPNKDGDIEAFTMSGLLNAIDGITSTDGRILVMTTNHPEKLDPALIRPGRADVHEMFDVADADAAFRMFERFYPEFAIGRKDFAARYHGHLTAAELQGVFMLYPNDPTAALATFTAKLESVA